MRVLLTALGTNNNSTRCKYLKNKKGIYIVGVDIYPSSYIPASKDVDKFYKVPGVNDIETFGKVIFEICKAEKIDYIFPVIDEEVEFLAKNKEKFSSIGVKISCSNLQSIKICRNKEETFKVVKTEVPEIYTNTHLLKENNIKKYPVFIKPISGRASSGCFKITNQKQLDSIIQMIDINEYIVQEFLSGIFFTVDFIRDAINNRFVCLVRQELVRNKNGCGTVIKIVHNEILEKLTEKLIKGINYQGVGNCEFIFSDNKYYLVEINPRISAGIDYSMRSNLNIIDSEIELLKNGKISINKDIKYDKIYVRRYETYEM